MTDKKLTKLLKEVEKMDPDEQKRLRELIKSRGESQNQSAELGWMYKGDKPDSEEYLLGKKIDRHIDKSLVSKEVTNSAAPGALFSEEFLHKRADLDMQAKMREDPLFAIRKKEEDAKRRILANPIKMKQLQQLVKEKEQDKQKKTKKRKKKGKKSEESDESSGDELLNKYLSIITHKRNNEESLQPDRARKLLMVESKEDVPSYSHSKNKGENISGHSEDKHSKYRHRDRSRSNDEKSHKHISNELQLSDEKKKRQRHESPGPRKTFRQQHNEYPESRKDHKRSRNESSEFREDYRQALSESRKDRRQSPVFKNDHRRLPESRKDRRQSSPEFRRDQRQSSSDLSPEPRRDHRQLRESKREQKQSSPESRRDHRQSSPTRRDHRQSSPTRRDHRQSSPVPKKDHRHLPGSRRDQGQSSPESRRDHGRHDNSSESRRDRRQSPKETAETKGVPKGVNIQSKHKSDRGVDKQPEGDTRQPSIKKDSGKESIKDEDSETSRQHSSKRTKLSEEEMAIRRREMMENAQWREEQRERNVQRYNKDEEKEEEELKKRKTGSASQFVNPMMMKHANQSSVEERIKRNIYNIQRTNADLEKNFAKR